MRKLWKSVLGLWMIGMGLGVSAPAQAASGIGPYYATPSWDQQLPASTRFIVLSNWGTGNEAVLDRETGLVWEQSPSTSTVSWLSASTHCTSLSKGGRKGWRLPTIQDLESLIDPAQSNPALPSGHPFSNVQSSVYWSAMTFANFPTPVLAWVVLFSDGSDGGIDKTSSRLAWCVRGGPGLDPQ